MKRLGIQLLSIVILFVALWLLSACDTPSKTDATPTEISETVGTTVGTTASASTEGQTTATTTDVYIPDFPYMTEEKKELVREAVVAWKDNFGKEISWSARGIDSVGTQCYGVYSGAVVLFNRIDGNEKTEIQVEELTYCYIRSFELWVYKNGAFYSLPDAYENAFLSKSDLLMILSEHRQEIRSIYYGEWSVMPKLEYIIPNEETDQQIKELYAQRIGDQTADDITYDCVAQFDDAYVIKITSDLVSNMVTYEEINGYLFTYPDSGTLRVFQGGEFYDLQTAFDEGIITDVELAVIHERYSPVRYN